MTAADPRSWMWAEACAMIERAEQLHRQFFRPGLARAPAANWEPPVDVFESERELTIVAALPGVVLPSSIGRKSSIAAAQEAVRSQRMLGVILQTDPAVEEPTPEQLHRVGTAAQVLRYVTAPDGTHHVVAQGVRRFRVLEYLRGFPFLVARVEEIGIAEVMTPDIEARVGLVRTRAREAIELLPNVPVEVAATIQ